MEHKERLARAQEKHRLLQKLLQNNDQEPPTSEEMQRRAEKAQRLKLKLRKRQEESKIVHQNQPNISNNFLGVVSIKGPIFSLNSQYYRKSPTEKHNNTHFNKNPLQKEGDQIVEENDHQVQGSPILKSSNSLGEYDRNAYPPKGISNNVRMNLRTVGRSSRKLHTQQNLDAILNSRASDAYLPSLPSPQDNNQSNPSKDSMSDPYAFFLKGDTHKHTQNTHKIQAHPSNNCDNDAQGRFSKKSSEIMNLFKTQTQKPTQQDQPPVQTKPNIFKSNPPTQINFSTEAKPNIFANPKIEEKNRQAIDKKQVAAPLNLMRPGPFANNAKQSQEAAPKAKNLFSNPKTPDAVPTLSLFQNISKDISPSPAFPNLSNTTGLFSKNNTSQAPPSQTPPISINPVPNESNPLKTTTSGSIFSTGRDNSNDNIFMKETSVAPVPLFGINTNTTENKNAPPVANIFGIKQPNIDAASTLKQSNPQPENKGLFSKLETNSNPLGGLFGNKQAANTNSQAPPSLFGRNQNKVNPVANLFGAKPAQASYEAPAPKNIFGLQSQPKQQLKLTSVPVKTNLFSGTPFNTQTASLFSKLQNTNPTQIPAKSIDQDQEEEGGEEDDGPIAAEQDIDPNKSTGKYEGYIHTHQYFKEQTNKFRAVTKTQMKDILENTTVSIQSFDNSADKFLFVRMPNKCIVFTGRIIPNTSAVPLNGSSKNVQITYVLQVDDPKKVEMVSAKIQFKEQAHGTAFINALKPK